MDSFSVYPEAYKIKNFFENSQHLKQITVFEKELHHMYLTGS